MKVGTDGVILGAWAPTDSNPTNILDIGCGSGLVTLMLAQRTPTSHLTGIDIDAGAYRQSLYNFEQSPWSDRLEALHSSLQAFSNNTPTKFDLIVSNPPFFSQSLKAPDQARSTARHNDLLPMNELMHHAALLLKTTGSIVLILPVADQNNCVKCAEEAGLFCFRTTIVYPKPGTVAKRILMEFKKTNSIRSSSELIVETVDRGVYTPEFKLLVREFYLKLQ